MKVKLLNDGGYGDLYGFDYDATIPAERDDFNPDCARVSSKTLVDHGADPRWLGWAGEYPTEPLWNFYIGSECVVVED